MSFSLRKDGARGGFPPRRYSVEKAHKLIETMCFSHKLYVKFPWRFCGNNWHEYFLEDVRRDRNSWPQ